MVKSKGLSRLGVVLLIAVFLNATLIQGVAASEEPDCEFDKKKPSLVHATIIFNGGDNHCAGMELDALIKDKNTNLEDRAAARVLLVKVYNAMIHEDLSKPIEGSETKPSEKPTAPAKDAVVEKQPEVQTKTTAFESDSARKPWYKKWWAMALGVGVVATVAAVAGGGSETPVKEEAPSALPPPPPPPGK